MIYLDHNATTPLHPEVHRAMLPYLGEVVGNPSSAHAFGRRTRAAIEQARREVARAIEADASEVVFTSGGTEGNNLALLGVATAHRGAHFVVSPIEHSSVVEPTREIERRGARVTWLPVDGQGRIEPDDVAAALEPDTVLVSVGWANNEIGTVQPVRAIAATCHARGVLLHVDAVQAFGKVPVDMSDMDLCSLSAHKIGGPLGVGALFVRRGVSLPPLYLGGGQERGARPGTENVAGLVGFGTVVTIAAATGQGEATLRERLWNGLAHLDGVYRNSPAEHCLANTLNVGFDGLRGEALVAALDLEGIAVSVGSACAVGSSEASHVLRAIGRTATEAADGVRFSLGRDTTIEEIDTTTAVVSAIVQQMRRIESPCAANG